MFEGLDFDLPESIGSFRNVDDLLLTLNSLVHVSEQVWSGISNEAPFQSLVTKIRAMQELASEEKFKRPRNDIFDVVTGTVESSDDEWFDAICEVMENSDFIDRFVRDTVLKRRTPAKKMRKAYENHNRTKDLSNSVWGQMLADPSVSVVGSWFNRKFRRRFRVPYSMFLEIVEECKEFNVFGVQLRRSKIKIEFKVLTCLKILGRDLCADEFDEHLNIAESTVNKFSSYFFTTMPMPCTRSGLTYRRAKILIDVRKVIVVWDFLDALVRWM
jgi:hypothetical protein